MPMQFEELDATTRKYMLDEFEADESGPIPYRSKALSAQGLAVYASFVRTAIKTETEVELVHRLNRDDFWHPMETYVRNGVAHQRRVNVAQAAERLGLTEFNTWYVRGLAKRLMMEGEQQCQVYRASLPKWEPSDCTSHEGRVVPVAEIYSGHRARYWPEPGDPSKFSIPFAPGCHHTIRRIK